MAYALLLAFITIVLGGVAWTWFIRSQDRAEPERWFMLGQMLIIGVGVALYAGEVNTAISRLIGVEYNPTWQSKYGFSISLFLSFLPFAAVEELLKGGAVWLVAYHTRAFNQVQDGMIYASMVAVGFAVMENIHYLGNFAQTGIALLVVGGAAMRVLMSSLLHIVCSALFGYGVARTKFYGRKALPSAWAYVLASVLLHALFNSILSLQGYGTLAGAVVALLGLLWVFYLFRKHDSKLVWTPVWQKR